MRELRRWLGDVVTFTDQARAALDHANVIRLARAEVRHRVSDQRPQHASALELAAVLSERPACINRMYVEDILSWPYRATRQHTKRLMRLAKVGATKTVGQLTERQIAVLMVELGVTSDNSSTLLAHTKKWPGGGSSAPGRGTRGEASMHHDRTRGSGGA